MKIALDIFGGLLTFAAIGSAIAKLLKVPDVMASVGVKPKQVPLLALLEIAGGLGVILGIWNKSLGVISSAALVLYFLGAISSHIRAKSKIADAGAAIGIFIIGCVTTYLQLKR